MDAEGAQQRLREGYFDAVARYSAEVRLSQSVRGDEDHTGSSRRLYICIEHTPLGCTFSTEFLQSQQPCEAFMTANDGDLRGIHRLGRWRRIRCWTWGVRRG
jgi:hypothetical protein